MLILLGVLMLIGLVILHELGHFWAARRAGIEVEEFGIGFPPKAKSLGKKNGTEYTLNWLPLGGFVKLKGEHDSDTTKGSFGAASLPAKVRVMVAGVIVNFLVAIFMLTIIAAVGLPKVIDNQFTVASDSKIVQQDVLALVGEDAPAPVAGVKSNDILRKIEQVSGCDMDSCNVKDIITASVLKDITPELAGETVLLTHVRAGEVLETQITLNTAEFVESNRREVNACYDDALIIDKEECPELQSYLGVIPSDYIKTQATWSAPIVATVFSGQVVQETLKSFGAIFADLFRGDTSTAKEQVTGVVGIGYILNELSQQGFMSILFLTAIISLSLAIMNILPIPALDGGRLFVTLLFRIIRKPLNKETEERIHGTGFAVLMLLFVLITIVDVQRFIIN